MMFEQWWETLSPSDFRMAVNMEDDERIKYFCKQAWRAGFEDAKEKAARLVWDTIDGRKPDIVFHSGSTALGNAVQELEEE